MEPKKTHSALLPQQEPTRPAGGCPAGTRPEDLLRGGDVGANPHPGQRVAVTDDDVAANSNLKTIINVPLASLLTHTFVRLLKVNDKSISEYCDGHNIQELNCIFSGTWGFDSSTGQALMENETYDENKIVSTTFTPLEIKIDTLNNQHRLWVNACPQSYGSCRPLRIQYRRYTTINDILDDLRWVEDQIPSLQPILAKTTKGHQVIAKCDLYLTVIDANVLNAITPSTSQQPQCPFCNVTSIDFSVDSKSTQDIRLKLGLSPVHVFVRVLEFLLCLAYKNDPAVYGAHEVNETQKSVIVDQRKKNIQNAIRDKLGIRVDVLEPKMGLTNDTNAAREALSDKNQATLAEILGIELWLLEDLYTILVTLNCGLPIDASKFDKFCKAVTSKYVQTYPWYKLRGTLHTILEHGENVIKNSVLTMSLPFEQVQEAKYKLWRYDTPETERDRVNIMSDLFHYALEDSDPVISSVTLRFRQKQIKFLSVTPAVQNLLKLPDVPDDIDDSDGSDDSDDKINPLEDYDEEDNGPGEVLVAEYNAEFD